MYDRQTAYSYHKIKTNMTSSATFFTVLFASQPSYYKCMNASSYFSKSGCHIVRTCFPPGQNSDSFPFRRLSGMSERPRPLQQLASGDFKIFLWKHQPELEIKIRGWNQSNWFIWITSDWLWFCLFWYFFWNITIYNWEQKIPHKGDIESLDRCG